MPRKKILVVEDDFDIAQLVEYNLGKSGHQVTVTERGDTAIKLAKTEPYDLMLLDLMLPGAHGMAVCQAIRSDPHVRSMAIVILSAKGDEEDIVAGLNAGADDYVTKPFSPAVLVRRVQTVLRRHEANVAGEVAPLVRERLCIDPNRHAITVDGEHVDLTFTQFAILHLLAQRPGWVFTRDQIHARVNASTVVTARSVDVHVVGIRQKLGLAGDLIETVRGIGYRFRHAAG